MAFGHVEQNIDEDDLKKAALYDCLRPEIRRLAHQMEQKFRLHDEERGDPFREFPNWQDFLEMRLEEETIEYHTAVAQQKPPSEVWKEVADICNIYLMKAINYERDWKREKVKG